MITYVTFFFDIGRQTDDPMNKFDNYFPNIERLLSMNINIIFFTTRDLLDRISKNFIIPPRINIQIMDYYFGFTEIEEIRKIYHDEQYQTGNPKKDTPEFIALTLGKFDAIKEAIKINPFNDEYYAWIDAGVFKIARHPELLLTFSNNIEKINQGIKIMLLNNIEEKEIINHDFIKTCRYKVAGGFFLGQKDEMVTFCDLIIKEKNEFKAKNLIGLEQEFMAIVYFYHKKLFNPYYGRFTDLFTNF